MTNIDSIVNKLAAAYPEARCSLNYDKDYQLLFAVRLSAQCTDARVEQITPALFAAYPTLEAFASAPLGELEELVKPCGFYKHKARDIKLAAVKLLEEFGGRLPDTMEELLSLPGVGRKTANLLLGDLFGKPGIVVDTHCIRLSRRMGLTGSADPLRIERELAALIAPEEQSVFCHRLVLHGRAVCRARRPLCRDCVIIGECAQIL